MNKSAVEIMNHLSADAFNQLANALNECGLITMQCGECAEKEHLDCENYCKSASGTFEKQRLASSQLFT